MKNYKGYNKKGKKRRVKNIRLMIFLLFCGASLLSLVLVNKDFNDVKASVDTSDVIEFNNLDKEYNYSSKMMKQDFGEINFVKGKDRLFIKEDALWVKYPTSKSGIESSGATINSKVNKSKEYNLEYEVYFDGCGKPFNYQDGGVLPGLSGGEFYDGTSKRTNKDGFHVMLTYNNYGYIYPLIYTVNDVNTGGNVYNNIGKFNEYAWNKVKMYVRVNDKEENNGVLRVWINDKLCFNNEEMRYVTTDLLIDTSNLCVYNNESDKPTEVEQFVYLDNYNIYIKDKKDVKK